MSPWFASIGSRRGGCRIDRRSSAVEVCVVRIISRPTTFATCSAATHLSRKGRREALNQARRHRCPGSGENRQERAKDRGERG